MKIFSHIPIYLTGIALSLSAFAMDGAQYDAAREKHPPTATSAIKGIKGLPALKVFETLGVVEHVFDGTPVKFTVNDKDGKSLAFVAAEPDADIVAGASLRVLGRITDDENFESLAVTPVDREEIDPAAPAETGDAPTEEPTEITPPAEEPAAETPPAEQPMENTPPTPAADAASPTPADSLPAPVNVGMPPASVNMPQLPPAPPVVETPSAPPVVETPSAPPAVIETPATPPAVETPPAPPANSETPPAPLSPKRQRNRAVPADKPAIKPPRVPENTTPARPSLIDRFRSRD